ncbi:MULTISPECIES: hypothetical protein [Streptomyces]|uniref:hypothetical protein n=1 Tax=Streptomyces TaxID=1883 RepID=UPI00163CD182|nr:hypothetical protein [Streptomyces sp. TYQ1024]
MDQIHSNAADRRPIPDLGRGSTQGLQESVGGLLGFTPLPPGAGEVGVHAGLPFGRRELAWAQLAADVESGADVAQGPVDADFVEGDGRRADGERGPAGGVFGSRRTAREASAIRARAWSRWPARAAVYEVVQSICAYAIACAWVARPVRSTATRALSTRRWAASGWPWCRRTMLSSRDAAAVAMGSPERSAYVMARSAVIRERSYWPIFVRTREARA